MSRSVKDIKKQKKDIVEGESGEKVKAYYTYVTAKLTKGREGDRWKTT